MIKELQWNHDEISVESEAGEAGAKAGRSQVAGPVALASQSKCHQAFAVESCRRQCGIRYSMQTFEALVSIGRNQ